MLAPVPTVQERETRRAEELRLLSEFAAQGRITKVGHTSEEEQMKINERNREFYADKDKPAEEEDDFVPEKAEQRGFEYLGSGNYVATQRKDEQG